jgi:hypothetical protein
VKSRFALSSPSFCATVRFEVYRHTGEKAVLTKDHEIGWAREIAWVRDGQVWADNRRAIQYQVQGASSDDECLIANFGSRNHDDWKVLRVKDKAGWTGSYPSADDAFAALKESMPDKVCAQCGKPLTEDNTAAINRPSDPSNVVVEIHKTCIDDWSLMNGPVDPKPSR